MKTFVATMFVMNLIAFVLRLVRLTGNFPTKGDSRDSYVFTTVFHLPFMFWAGYLLWCIR